MSEMIDRFLKKSAPAKGEDRPGGTADADGAQQPQTAGEAATGARAKPRADAEPKTQPMLRALKAMHSFSMGAETDLEGLQRQRRNQELLGRLITPERGFRWKPFRYKKIPMAWVIPEHSHPARPVILYCHGGGYTSGSLGYARILASKLAAAAGCNVLTFAYRLAPEDPYPAALEDAMTVWNLLMYRGYGASEVVLVGDSAGGNLALELTARLKREKRLLPRRLVLFSPWTDMTATSGSCAEMDGQDPIVSMEYLHQARQAYAPNAQDYAAPELSPLFADLTGFPPTLIQVGEVEMLRDDSVRLKQAMDEAQVPCLLRRWPGMWHLFQTFPIREAREAMGQVGDFLRELH